MKKHKKLTKKQLEERRHWFVIFYWVIFIIASVVVAYDYALMMRGGWDDIRFFDVVFAPFLAALFFMLTIIYLAKLNGRKRIIWFALALFVTAGLFFSFGVVGVPIMWARSSTESISKNQVNIEYECSGIRGGDPEYWISLQENGSFGIYSDSDNLTGFYDISNDGLSSEMRVWFGGQFENVEPYYFSETEYDISRDGDYTILRSEKVTRYCKVR